MLLLFGMAWERYRVRRFILMTGILWHFLPPSETSYGEYQLRLLGCEVMDLLLGDLILLLSSARHLSEIK